MYSGMIIGLYKNFEDKIKSLYSTIGEKLSFSLPISGGLELALYTNTGKNYSLRDSFNHDLPVYFAKGKDRKKPKKATGGTQFDTSRRPKGISRKKFLRLRYDLTKGQVEREIRKKKKKKT